MSLHPQQVSIRTLPKIISFSSSPAPSAFLTSIYFSSRFLSAKGRFIIFRYPAISLTSQETLIIARESSQVRILLTAGEKLMLPGIPIKAREQLRIMLMLK